MLGQKILEVSAEHVETTRLKGFIGISGVSDDEFHSKLTKYRACATPILDTLSALGGSERLLALEKKAADNGMPVYETRARDHSISNIYLRYISTVGIGPEVPESKVQQFEAWLADEAQADQQHILETNTRVQSECGDDPYAMARGYSYARGVIKEEVPSVALNAFTVTSPRWQLEQGNYLKMLWASSATFTVSESPAVEPLVDDATSRNQLVCSFAFLAVDEKVVKGKGVWNLKEQTVAFHPE